MDGWMFKVALPRSWPCCWVLSVKSLQRHKLPNVNQTNARSETVKIIWQPRDIPSMKLIETELSYSFMDIGPIAKYHALHTDHAQKLHELPDEHLQDMLPVAKRIALAIGCEDYNILQNNGRPAHQFVDHVHFHVIPKPSKSDEEGLVIGWPAQAFTKDELQKSYEELKSRL
ncbi:hypothetical protein Clacol_009628 [Clathrus columnatus]|uniref:HIT domain-containing protein n=1 Tax=Clathrus columnatus TaxID=1419009 RepID=A0AAV5ANI2_9AGAM|nr:hypothetical protein Clacol_009628 [Clathrus columnatus]